MLFPEFFICGVSVTNIRIIAACALLSQEKIMINLRQVPILIAQRLVLSGWLVICSSSPWVASWAVTSVFGADNSAPMAQVRSPKTVTTIPFESLAQGDSYTAELQTPTLFIAGNASQADRFIRFLNDPAIAQRIQAIDFNTTWVVSVFRGQVASSGYGITIEEISTAPGTVRLRVNLTDPAYGQNVSDIIAYPYHAVLVPKDRIPQTPGTNWAVYTLEGKLLVRTHYPLDQ